MSGALLLMAAVIVAGGGGPSPVAPDGSSAHALPMDAYGLTIGKPLDFPDCPKSPYRWLPPNTGPCLRGVLGPETSPADRGLIAFPPLIAPRYSQADVYFRRDGTSALILLQIETRGPSVQQALFDDLILKYGQPKSSSVEKLTNAVGGSFEAIVASWESDALRVEFVGMNSLKAGQLVIGTPAAVAAKSAEAKRLTQRGRGL